MYKDTSWRRLIKMKKDHLEMIQGIINRISNNSFLLKGWAVTLVAGIFALANKDSDKTYFLIAYVPIIVFWGLDAYYLRQERLFRKLYNKICSVAEFEINFSMDISLLEFRCRETDYFSCVLSATELFFYLPLTLLSALITYIAY